jgi:hypothetical protein
MDENTFKSICEILAVQKEYELLATFITFVEDSLDDDYSPEDPSPEPKEEFNSSSSVEEEEYKVITDKDGFMSLK